MAPLKEGIMCVSMHAEEIEATYVGYAKDAGGLSSLVEINKLR